MTWLSLKEKNELISSGQDFYMYHVNFGKTLKSPHTQHQCWLLVREEEGIHLSGWREFGKSQLL